MSECIRVSEWFPVCLGVRLANVHEIQVWFIQPLCFPCMNEIIILQSLDGCSREMDHPLETVVPHLHQMRPPLPPGPPAAAVSTVVGVTIAVVGRGDVEDDGDGGGCCCCCCMLAAAATTAARN